MRLQGYQTCAGAGMLASGLANGVLVQHLVFAGLPDLFPDFGGSLKKHLFLGRTLLLRFQGYQTCGSAGMLAPGRANAALVQHLVLGVFSAPFHTFRWLTKEDFVLRMDAAFATPGLPNLCWCRNACSRASKGCAGAAFGGSGVFGSRRTKLVLVHECWLQG